MNAIRERLESLGFTIAGGPWGDAAWRRLGDGLAVSIGQAEGYALSAPPAVETDLDAYLDAPDNDADPCAVFVYRGALGGWHASEGEAPEDADCSIYGPMSLGAAIRFVQDLAG